MKYFHRILFRPTPKPSLNLPLSARSVGHYCVPPEFHEPPLAKYFIQIFWGIRNTGVFIFKRSEQRLPPDHIAIYFPGMVHNLFPDQEPWEYRWWTMDGPLAVNIVNSFGLTQAGIYPVGPAPEALFEQLHDAIGDITPSGERHADTIAYQLLSLAANRRQTAHGPHPHIQQAVLLIHQQWNQPDFGVDCLARRLNIHRSLFSRLFHSAIGVAPRDYINNLRIQRALSLLKQTNLPIAQIAQQCGFNDPNYFARAIRKKTQWSPGEFRRR